MISFDKYQARAPQPSRLLCPEDFTDQGQTLVYWLGSAGVFVNSHGSTLMIDPVLGYMESEPRISEAYEILMVQPPIQPEQVPALDALCYTHSDWDHLSKHTAVALQPKAREYHGTYFVDKVLRYFGIHGKQRRGHAIGESFWVGDMRVTLTPADHVYQFLLPERFDWSFKKEDCCGYLIETRDGTVWVPGDTRLLDEHLDMHNADLVFMDYSDHSTHFGREAALRLSNALCDAQIVMYHYGTYYKPDLSYFNADPQDVLPYIKNPERLHLVAPGEGIILQGRHCLS